MRAGRELVAGVLFGVLAVLFLGYTLPALLFPRVGLEPPSLAEVLGLLGVAMVVVSAVGLVVRVVRVLWTRT
jgi:hypothetical protein